MLDAGIETLQLEKMIFTEKFVKDVSLISLQKVSKEVLSKIIAFIIFLIFLDFSSKELALNNLEQGQLNETFFPFIDLLLIYNSGIAFGMLDDEGIFVSYALLTISIALSTPAQKPLGLASFISLFIFYLINNFKVYN